MEKRSETLSLTIHAKRDGAFEIKYGGSVTTSEADGFTVAPIEIDGEDRYAFRVEKEEFTVAGSIPMYWSADEPNELTVDTTQSEGDARYDFEITADEGMGVNLERVLKGDRQAGGPGRRLVMERFTLTPLE